MKSWIAPSGDWCNLCKQPFGSWFEHVSGRFKDHRAMEIIYSSYIESGYRRWTPKDLYMAVGLNKFFHFQTDRLILDDSKAHIIRTECGSVDFLKQPFLPLYAVFTSLEHAMKRKIHHILKFLYANHHLRAFVTVDMGHLKAMDFLGTRLMYYHLAKPLVRCFPKASSGQLSTFHHIAFDPYNLESVYDIIGMKDIFGDVYSEDYRSKGLILRILFADLHHLSNGTVQKSEGIRMLAGIAMMLLTAEIISVKMMEYCLRVDMVWRELQCEVNPEGQLDNNNCIYKRRFQNPFPRDEEKSTLI